LTKKPNIIYIFSDQHRGDTLGCVGHPAVITPNLDKLATEGVVFKNCFTNSPLCMPARATMMTGKHVCEHGIWDNNNEADPLGPSHVRNIQDAGYHTALIGKTHLYVHSGERKWKHTKEKVQVLKDWGFDDIMELTGPLGTVRHDSPYTDYLKEKGLLRKHRDYMLEYAVKYFSQGILKPWELPPYPLNAEDHLDSYTGQKTVEWIQNYEGNNPFYLQILFPGPHDPFDTPAEYRQMYEPAKMPIGILEWPKRPIPSNVERILNRSGLKDMTPAQNQLLRVFYYAKITLIDYYIGKIIEALKERSLLDNTWIIYSSDHGEMLGDHFMSQKVVFYEGAIRVPLIVRPPGGTKGWTCEGLTDHLDITSSLLHIAGASPLERDEGVSFISKVMEGANSPEAQSGKDVVFSEVLKFSMVRDERYKLVVKSNTLIPVEFYDLENDPDELNNLVRDPSVETIREELLENHLKKLLNRMRT